MNWDLNLGIKSVNCSFDRYFSSLLPSKEFCYSIHALFFTSRSCCYRYIFRNVCQTLFSFESVAMEMEVNLMDLRQNESAFLLTKF